MKKILLVFMFLLFLVGCGKKGCNNETVEFDHSGILTYYLDENPTDKLKELKLKVTNKGKETVYLLNDESIKISGFNFDKIGEYKALVTFNNNTYSFKYKVEIRKWDEKSSTSWYTDDKDILYISTANELAGLAKLVNDGNDFSGKVVKLKYDIDLNNLSWIPIGTNGVGSYREFNKCFSGTFDGDGHTIYNLYTKAEHKNVGEHLDSETSYYHFGLFGYVKNGTIKNVTIQNVDITNGMGNEFKRSFQGTGALVGYTNGEVLIENVKVLGKINIKGEYKIGGVVGSSGGTSITVKNTYVRGDDNSFIGGTDEEFKDTNNFGGIVGFTATSKTILVNVLTDVDVDGYTCGGIIGNVTEGTFSLTNACVYGDISNKEGSVVGGLVGGRFVNMKLSNCYVIGLVSSGSNTYADILVSKYGDGSVNIEVENVYFNNVNFDETKVHNSLNATSLSKEELEKKIPLNLK